MISPRAGGESRQHAARGEGFRDRNPGWRRGSLEARKPYPGLSCSALSGQLCPRPVVFVVPCRVEHQKNRLVYHNEVAGRGHRSDLSPGSPGGAFLVHSARKRAHSDKKRRRRDSNPGIMDLQSIALAAWPRRLDCAQPRESLPRSQDPQNSTVVGASLPVTPVVSGRRGRVLEERSWELTRFVNRFPADGGRFRLAIAAAPLAIGGL